MLFPVATLACSKAFQEITPEQLKARLSLIFENKDSQNLDINPSIPYVLTVNSKTGTQFQVIIDYSLTEPTIVFSAPFKILKVPSLAWLYKSSSDNLIKNWLIGHEIHSDINSSKKNQRTETQTTRTFRNNNKKEKPPFEKLVEILISKSIFSGTKWEQQKEIDPDLKHIPKVLSQAYKEWSEKGGWRYVNKKAGREYKKKGRVSRKPTFEELIEILISKSIFSETKWEQQKAIDPDLKHMPKALSQAYKEWSKKGGWKYVRKQANKEKDENQEAIEN